MQVWNVLRAARWKCRTQKSPSEHYRTTLSGYFFATKVRMDNRKNLLNNIVNFGLLAAEICWRVWGTPANFNGFRVGAALLHGSPLVGVSQTLRRWTEGATYIRQGGHHVGHWPTFLVFYCLIAASFAVLGSSFLCFHIRVCVCMCCFGVIINIRHICYTLISRWTLKSDLHSRLKTKLSTLWLIVFDKSILVITIAFYQHV